MEQNPSTDTNSRPRSTGRLGLIKAGSAMTAALLLSGVLAGPQALAASAAQAKTIKAQSVKFKNGAIQMAGDVYLPDGFDKGRQYSAIVVVHPNGGVKEQTAGLYAQRLAQQGFVTLAFDASHQGASGGMPRFLDDPMKRVGDIYSAMDYVTSLPYVDADRVGVLGICAGSGATIKAATIDRRIKAVATVSAVDVGAASRKGWDGKGSERDQMATLESVAKERTAEAAGATPVYVSYVPQVGDRTAPRDLQEAADYYLTPRGQHPNAPNKMLMISLSNFVAFSAFDRVEHFLTQPVLVVAGTEAGSLWHSQELYAKAPGPKKELFLVKGATHMDLYDGPGVGSAMEKLAPFFKSNLTTSD